MKRFGRKHHGSWLMLVYLSMVTVFGIVAYRAVMTTRAPVPTIEALPALDLGTVAPCPAEDGPGLDGTVPCVFTSPDNGRGDRWVLYADWCPVTTVQASVRCVPQTEWARD